MRVHHTSVAPYVTNAVALPGQTEPPETILQQYCEGTSHTLRAMVGMLEGDAEAANQAFEKARQANPHDRDVASIFEEMRGEVRAYETAIRQVADSPDYRARLARNYMLLQQYAQAVRQYEQLLATKPNYAGAWTNLGVCYRLLGELDKAQKALRHATQLAPGLLQASRNLALVAEAYARKGNYPAATDTLEFLLPLLPGLDRAQACDHLAHLLCLQQRYDLALKYLDTAMELTKDDPQLLSYLSSKRQQVADRATMKR
jgi:tetratricopeptide (TPR) repeat protein